MPRALDVLQVMEDVCKSHVAGTCLSSNNLHSQMEGNMYKRKSDAGTFRYDENLEEAPASSSGTAVTIGNQADISTISSKKTSQQVGP